MFTEIFRFELKQQLKSPLFWMIALAFAALTPARGASSGGPVLVAAATPRPSTLLPRSAQPTPYPEITLGPANAPTSLPFPAYGSPVPGVGVGPAPSGLPQIVTLKQAEDIAFARVPSLASARADAGIAHAAVRLAQTGYLPSLAGSGTTTHARVTASRPAPPSPLRAARLRPGRSRTERR